MSPKQGRILNELQGWETITLARAVELIGSDIYHNAAKHVGALLSNMVKRGMIEREKPGVFRLPKSKPEAARFQARAMSAQPMRRVCEFSPCRRWRFTLWREWDMFNPLPLMVVGLNPSTADEHQDDPTIRRCIGFAKAWGFGALCMTNLFAWRDTQPAGMKAAAEPVGDQNDAWLKRCASEAGLILAAWGTHGAHLERAARVLSILPPVHCLAINQDGSPKHPLYVSKSSRPLPFPR